MSSAQRSPTKADNPDGKNNGEISGPHREPAHVGGALYWRCEQCGMESIDQEAMSMPFFHSDDCEVAE